MLEPLNLGITLVLLGVALLTWARHIPTTRDSRPHHRHRHRPRRHGHTVAATAILARCAAEATLSTTGALR